MQCSLFLSALLLAVAAAQESTYDPTTRDKTADCQTMADYAQTIEKKCQLLDMCCQNDPLNGDRCQQVEKKCEKLDDGEVVVSCKYFNCTPQVTTTTTTTTAAPVNAAAGASLLMLLSAFLPRFLL